MLVCCSLQAVQGRQSVESALQAQKRQQAAAAAVASEQAEQLRHAVVDLEQAQAALANAQQELSLSQERLSGADALSGRTRQLQQQLQEMEQQAADAAQLLGVKDAQLEQLQSDLQAGEPEMAAVQAAQQDVMVWSAHGSTCLISDTGNTTMTPVHEEHAWIAVLDHAGQQQMATMRAAVEALEATKSRLMADLEQRQTALDAAGTRAAAREEALAQQTADNKWLQVQCHFAVCSSLSCSEPEHKLGSGAGSWSCVQLSRSDCWHAAGARREAISSLSSLQEQVQHLGCLEGKLAAQREQARADQEKHGQMQAELSAAADRESALQEQVQQAGRQHEKDVTQIKLLTEQVASLQQQQAEDANSLAQAQAQLQDQAEQAAQQQQRAAQAEEQHAALQAAMASLHERLGTSGQQSAGKGEEVEGILAHMQALQAQLDAKEHHIRLQKQQVRLRCKTCLAHTAADAGPAGQLRPRKHHVNIQQQQVKNNLSNAPMWLLCIHLSRPSCQSTQTLEMRLDAKDQHM